MKTTAGKILESQHNCYSLRHAAFLQCTDYFQGMSENEIYCFADDSRLSIPYAEGAEIEEI